MPRALQPPQPDQAAKMLPSNRKKLSLFLFFFPLFFFSFFYQNGKSAALAEQGGAARLTPTPTAPRYLQGKATIWTLFTPRSHGSWLDPHPGHPPACSAEALQPRGSLQPSPSSGFNPRLCKLHISPLDNSISNSELNLPPPAAPLTASHALHIEHLRDPIHSIAN